AGPKIVLFSPFFTFFQSRNSGYASSKTQKLTKKTQIFDSVRKSPTCSKFAGYPDCRKTFVSFFSVSIV
ncbi:MAG TPA: hypothetical protein VK168_06510, partial [Saprospiraceae bacterium]|nr:hypothetical protein [Saprospiraceae bacterium]